MNRVGLWRLIIVLVWHSIISDGTAGQVIKQTARTWFGEQYHIHTPVTASDADKACQNSTLQLASITNAQQVRDLQWQLSQSSVARRIFWVDFNATSSEFGLTVTQTNSKNSSQICTALDLKENGGQFVQLKCDAVHSALCTTQGGPQAALPNIRDWQPIGKVLPQVQDKGKYIPSSRAVRCVNGGYFTDIEVYTDGQVVYAIRPQCSTGKLFVEGMGIQSQSIILGEIPNSDKGYWVQNSGQCGKGGMLVGFTGNSANRTASISSLVPICCKLNVSNDNGILQSDSSQSDEAIFEGQVCSVGDLADFVDFQSGFGVLQATQQFQVTSICPANMISNSKVRTLLINFINDAAILGISLYACENMFARRGESESTLQQAILSQSAEYETIDVTNVKGKWVDIQCQGGLNDYCLQTTNTSMRCALSGRHITTAVTNQHELMLSDLSKDKTTVKQCLKHHKLDVDWYQIKSKNKQCLQCATIDLDCGFGSCTQSEYQQWFRVSQNRVESGLFPGKCINSSWSSYKSDSMLVSKIGDSKYSLSSANLVECDTIPDALLQLVNASNSSQLSPDANQTVINTQAILQRVAPVRHRRWSDDLQKLNQALQDVSGSNSAIDCKSTHCSNKQLSFDVLDSYLLLSNYRILLEQRPVYCNWPQIKCNSHNLVDAIIIRETANYKPNGKLSPFLLDFPQLKVVEVSAQNVSGSLPWLSDSSTRVSQLRSINITGTQATGAVPGDWFIKANFPQLRQVSIANNRLHGPLPSALSIPNTETSDPAIVQVLPQQNVSSSVTQVCVVPIGGPPPIKQDALLVQPEVTKNSKEWLFQVFAEQLADTITPSSKVSQNSKGLGPELQACGPLVNTYASTLYSQSCITCAKGMRRAFRSAFANLTGQLATNVYIGSCEGSVACCFPSGEAKPNSPPCWVSMAVNIMTDQEGNSTELTTQALAKATSQTAGVELLTHDQALEFGLDVPNAEQIAEQQTQEVQAPPPRAEDSVSDIEEDLLIKPGVNTTASASPQEQRSGLDQTVPASVPGTSLSQGPSSERAIETDGDNDQSEYSDQTIASGPQADGAGGASRDIGSIDGSGAVGLKDSGGKDDKASGDSQKDESSKQGTKKGTSPVSGDSGKNDNSGKQIGKGSGKGGRGFVRDSRKPGPGSQSNAAVKAVSPDGLDDDNSRSQQNEKKGNAISEPQGFNQKISGSKQAPNDIKNREQQQRKRPTITIILPVLLGILILPAAVYLLWAGISRKRKNEINRSIHKAARDQDGSQVTVPVDLWSGSTAGGEQKDGGGGTGSGGKAILNRYEVGESSGGEIMPLMHKAVSDREYNEDDAHPTLYGTGALPSSHGYRASQYGKIHMISPEDLARLELLNVWRLHIVGDENATIKLAQLAEQQHGVNIAQPMSKKNMEGPIDVEQLLLGNVNGAIGTTVGQSNKLNSTVMEKEYNQQSSRALITAPLDGAPSKTATITGYGGSSVQQPSTPSEAIKEVTPRSMLDLLSGGTGIASKTQTMNFGFDNVKHESVLYSNQTANTTSAASTKSQSMHWRSFARHLDAYVEKSDQNQREAMIQELLAQYSDFLSRLKNAGMVQDHGMLQHSTLVSVMEEQLHSLSDLQLEHFSKSWSYVGQSTGDKVVSMPFQQAESLSNDSSSPERFIQSEPNTAFNSRAMSSTTKVEPIVEEDSGFNDAIASNASYNTSTTLHTASERGASDQLSQQSKNTPTCASDQQKQPHQLSSGDQFYSPTLEENQHAGNPEQLLKTAASKFETNSAVSGKDVNEIQELNSSKDIPLRAVLEGNQSPDDSDTMTVQEALGMSDADASHIAVDMDNLMAEPRHQYGDGVKPLVDGEEVVQVGICENEGTVADQAVCEPSLECLSATPEQKEQIQGEDRSKKSPTMGGAVLRMLYRAFQGTDATKTVSQSTNLTNADKQLDTTQQSTQESVQSISKSYKPRLPHSASDQQQGGNTTGAEIVSASSRSPSQAHSGQRTLQIQHEVYPTNMLEHKRTGQVSKSSEITPVSTHNVKTTQGKTGSGTQHNARSRQPPGSERVASKQVPGNNVLPVPDKDFQQRIKYRYQQGQYKFRLGYGPPPSLAKLINRSQNKLKSPTSGKLKQQWTKEGVPAARSSASTPKRKSTLDRRQLNQLTPKSFIPSGARSARLESQSPARPIGLSRSVMGSSAHEGSYATPSPGTSARRPRNGIPQSAPSPQHAWRPTGQKPYVSTPTNTSRLAKQTGPNDPIGGKFISTRQQLMFHDAPSNSSGPVVASTVDSQANQVGSREEQDPIGARQAEIEGRILQMTSQIADYMSNARAKGQVEKIQRDLSAHLANNPEDEKRGTSTNQNVKKYVQSRRNARGGSHLRIVSPDGASVSSYGSRVSQVRPGSDPGGAQETSANQYLAWKLRKDVPGSHPPKPGYSQQKQSIYDTQMSITSSATNEQNMAQSEYGYSSMGKQSIRGRRVDLNIPLANERSSRRVGNSKSNRGQPTASRAQQKSPTGQYGPQHAPLTAQNLQNLYTGNSIPQLTALPRPSSTSDKARLSSRRSASQRRAGVDIMTSMARTGTPSVTGAGTGTRYSSDDDDQGNASKQLNSCASSLVGNIDGRCDSVSITYETDKRDGAEQAEASGAVERKGGKVQLHKSLYTEQAYGVARRQAKYQRDNSNHQNTAGGGDDDDESHCEVSLEQLYNTIVSTGSDQLPLIKIMNSSRQQSAIRAGAGSVASTAALRRMRHERDLGTDGTIVVDARAAGTLSERRYRQSMIAVGVPRNYNGDSGRGQRDHYTGGHQVGEASSHNRHSRKQIFIRAAPPQRLSQLQQSVQPSGTSVTSSARADSRGSQSSQTTTNASYVRGAYSAVAQQVGTDMRDSFNTHGQRASGSKSQHQGRQAKSLASPSSQSAYSAGIDGSPLVLQQHEQLDRQGSDGGEGAEGLDGRTTVKSTRQRSGLNSLFSDNGGSKQNIGKSVRVLGKPKSFNHNRNHEQPRYGQQSSLQRSNSGGVYQGDDGKTHSRIHTNTSISATDTGGQSTHKLWWLQTGAHVGDMQDDCRQLTYGDNNDINDGNRDIQTGRNSLQAHVIDTQLHTLESEGDRASVKLNFLREKWTNGSEDSFDDQGTVQDKQNNQGEQQPRGSLQPAYIGNMHKLMEQRGQDKAKNGPVKSGLKGRKRGSRCYSLDSKGELQGLYTVQTDRNGLVQSVEKTYIHKPSRRSIDVRQRKSLDLDTEPNILSQLQDGVSLDLIDSRQLHTVHEYGVSHQATYDDAVKQQSSHTDTSNALDTNAKPSACVEDLAINVSDKQPESGLDRAHVVSNDKAVESDQSAYTTASDHSQPYQSVDSPRTSTQYQSQDEHNTVQQDAIYNAHSAQTLDNQLSATHTDVHATEAADVIEYVQAMANAHASGINTLGESLGDQGSSTGIQTLQSRILGEQVLELLARGIVSGNGSSYPTPRGSVDETFAAPQLQQILRKPDAHITQGRTDQPGTFLNPSVNLTGTGSINSDVLFKIVSEIKNTGGLSTAGGNLATKLLQTLKKHGINTSGGASDGVAEDLKSQAEKIRRGPDGIPSDQNDEASVLAMKRVSSTGVRYGSAGHLDSDVKQQLYTIGPQADDENSKLPPRDPVSGQTSLHSMQWDILSATTAADSRDLASMRAAREAGTAKSTDLSSNIEKSIEYGLPDSTGEFPSSTYADSMQLPDIVQVPRDHIGTLFVGTEQLSGNASANIPSPPNVSAMIGHVFKVTEQPNVERGDGGEQEHERHDHILEQQASPGETPEAGQSPSLSIIRQPVNASRHSIDALARSGAVNSEGTEPFDSLKSTNTDSCSGIESASDKGQQKAISNNEEGQNQTAHFRDQDAQSSTDRANVLTSNESLANQIAHDPTAGNTQQAKSPLQCRKTQSQPTVSKSVIAAGSKADSLATNSIIDRLQRVVTGASDYSSPTLPLPPTPHSIEPQGSGYIPSFFEGTFTHDSLVSSDTASSRSEDFSQPALKPALSEPLPVLSSLSMAQNPPLPPSRSKLNTGVSATQTQKSAPPLSESRIKTQMKLQTQLNTQSADNITQHTCLHTSPQESTLAETKCNTIKVRSVTTPLTAHQLAVQSRATASTASKQSTHVGQTHPSTPPLSPLRPPLSPVGDSEQANVLITPQHGRHGSDCTDPLLPSNFSTLSSARLEAVTPQTDTNPDGANTLEPSMPAALPSMRLVNPLYNEDLMAMLSQRNSARRPVPPSLLSKKTKESAAKQTGQSQSSPGLKENVGNSGKSVNESEQLAQQVDDTAYNRNRGTEHIAANPSVSSEQIENVQPIATAVQHSNAAAVEQRIKIQASISNSNKADRERSERDSQLDTSGKPIPSNEGPIKQTSSTLNDAAIATQQQESTTAIPDVVTVFDQAGVDTVGSGKPVGKDVRAGGIGEQMSSMFRRALGRNKAKNQGINSTSGSTVSTQKTGNRRGNAAAVDTTTVSPPTLPPSASDPMATPQSSKKQIQQHEHSTPINVADSVCTPSPLRPRKSGSLPPPSSDWDPQSTANQATRSPLHELYGDQNNSNASSVAELVRLPSLGSDSKYSARSPGGRGAQQTVGAHNHVGVHNEADGGCAVMVMPLDEDSRDVLYSE